MKLVLVLACLIQLSSSCSCASGGDDPALFCRNPTWNAVMVTVTKVTKDLPNLDDLFEKHAPMQSFAGHQGNPGDKLEPFATPVPRWQILETWFRAEREVEAVVEKVWGLGSMKEGQVLTLWSHNYDSLCGVARALNENFSTILWVPQDVTRLNVAGCAIYRFYSWDRDPVEYMDSFPTCCDKMC